MKKIISTFLCGLIGGVAFGQWTPTTFTERGGQVSNVKQFYKLDINKIREQLKGAQETGKNAKPIEISLPTMDGKIEKFAMYSFPVMVKDLADQYQLGSYVGVGINDPAKYIRFSVAPNDFQSMIIKDGAYEFIEPVNQDKTIYGVHPKSNKSKEGFTCSTKESKLSKAELSKLYTQGKSFTNQPANFAQSSDKKYRTMRLALSVTGKYTQFFGGTVAGALTAMNATMTRVNGVYEKDFALHLNIQNYPGIIYTDAATDPYTNDLNVQLQQTLTANVGNANYDIGHVFNAEGNDGNAGCVGCICVDPASASDTEKGSGFTQTAAPQGDNFDIDFVAHEMGHQIGANHTYAIAIEGTGVNMEPGSGSTIMGYAGITGVNNDVQAHSDPYFHIANIRQVQANLTSKTCDIETVITNNPPVISSLPTYNIPKGTAFILTASATDPENDPISYTWEEVDDAAVLINKNNLGTTNSGASFRSFNPTTSPVRYFPKFSSVMAGALDNSLNTWESVSMVPRTTKFAVTVRDNNTMPAQQQTQYAEEIIVVGNDGPFKVNSQYAYPGIPSTILWDVANTTTAPYNVANVKIDYTTDNGTTWMVLSASTANDGSESFTFPASLNGQTIKLRISSIGNIFYAVKAINIASPVACDGSSPTGVTTSNITFNSANVNWAPITGATYIIRYKKVSETVWQQMTSSSENVTINGLNDNTAYEVQVAAVCSGTTGAYSASVNFTTLPITYCTSTSSDASEEYISNVTLANLNNTSGASTYTNYTTDLSKVVNLIKGSTYSVSVKKTWPADLYDEAVRVWIDFNKNGTFENSEMVMDSAPSQIMTVSSSFTVPAAAALNQALRMRVALSYNAAYPACGGFAYGEVEDYNVIITDVLATNELNHYNDGVKVYPNPASDILNITKVSNKAKFEIHNVVGQLVKGGTIENNQVRVQDLVKGTYIITIKDNNISENIKFIKK